MPECRVEFIIRGVPPEAKEKLEAAGFSKIPEYDLLRVIDGDTGEISSMPSFHTVLGKWETGNNLRIFLERPGYNDIMVLGTPQEVYSVCNILDIPVRIRRMQ